MSLYLHCVFHGIRFKVNGRLVVGMTINFFIPLHKLPTPNAKHGIPTIIYRHDMQPYPARKG